MCHWFASSQPVSSIRLNRSRPCEARSNNRKLKTKTLVAKTRTCGTESTGDIDPSPLGIGLKHRVGHRLSFGPIVEAWHRVAPFDNRTHEFKHRIVAEHSTRFALGRV